jgi:hypothetical protein
MVSSGILHRVALVRTDVSEEPSASFIRVTRIDGLGTRTSVASCRLCCSYFTYSCHPDEGDARILRNVCSYKNHTA